MSKEQLVLRLLSSVANIDSQRLRSGFLEELDFARIAPAMNALSEAPIYIDDTPNISAMELRTKARRLQAEAGLDLVIVDYLQLMQATTTNRDANRVQEVSEISRGLKALARELSIPVIALLAAVTPAGDARVEGAAPVGPARVRRDRAGRRPRRCSCGARRSAAPTTRSRRARSSTSSLAKHRNGPTGEIQLWFKKRQTRFVGYATRAPSVSEADQTTPAAQGERWTPPVRIFSAKSAGPV